MSADVDAIYTSDLTYEQRAKLRRERRERRRNGSEQNGLSSCSKRTLTPTNNHFSNGSTSPIPNLRSTSRASPTPMSGSTILKLSQRQNSEGDSVFETRSLGSIANSEMDRTSRGHSEPPIESPSNRKVQPLKARSSTVSDIGPDSQRCHSPLAVRLASLHLAGLIGKQQEKERSHSPSPSPLTPSSSKSSSKQRFFSDLDQTTTTGSNLVTQNDIATKLPDEGRASSNSLTEEDAVFNSPKASVSSTAKEVAPSRYTFVETDKEDENLVSGEYNHLDAINGSERLRDALEVFDSYDPAMPVKTSLTSQSSLQTPPMAMASDPVLAKVAAEGELSGRESQGSNVSESKSFTFEDFGWSEPKPVLPVPMPLDSPLPQNKLEHSSTTTDHLPSITSSRDDPGKDRQGSASGLKFTDTDASPGVRDFTDANTWDRSSDTSNASRGQAVYRPIDVMKVEDITVVPSSGFFDMSQQPTQPPLEFDQFSPPAPVLPYSSAIGSAGVRVSSVGGEGGEGGEGTKKGKSKKESNPKLRKSSHSDLKIGESKSPSRLRKKLLSSSKPDEKKSKSESSPKRKEKSKEDTKKSPKKQGSLLERSSSDSASRKMKIMRSPLPQSEQNHSQAELGSPTAKPASSPLLRKPPLPANAKSKKTGSSSFRSERRTEGSSWSSQGSLPNLSSPTPSSVSSEISTVDSSIPDIEKSPKISAFRRRISQSMRSLLGDRNPSSKTGWQFADGSDVSKYKPGGPVLLSYKKIDDRNDKARSSPPSFPSSPSPSIELHTASSETRLASVTDSDREHFLEDLEQIPRAYSLDRKKKHKTISSDDSFFSSVEKPFGQSKETATAKFSERLVDGPPQFSERSVDAPVNERLVDGPPQFSERSVDPPVNERLVDGPATDVQYSERSVDPPLSSSDSDEYLTASDSEVTVSSQVVKQPSAPPSSTRETSLLQNAAPHIEFSGTSSSAVDTASAHTSLPKNEPEPSVKSKLPMKAGKIGSAEKTTSAKLSPKSTAKASPRTGILKSSSVPSSRITISSKMSPLSSPVLSQRSPLKSQRRVISVGSPQSSPLTSRKTTPTSSAKTTPIRKTTPSTKLSPTATKKTTPTSPRKITPTSSRKTTPSHVTSKSSPVATRKTTPSKVSPILSKKSIAGKSTPSPKSSPLTDRKKSPSKLSPKAGDKLAKPVKLAVERSTSPPTAEVGSNSPQSASNFSRFSRGRVPIRKSPIATATSPRTKRSSTIAQQPSESLEERVSRIRHQRKSEVIPRSLGGLEEIESAPQASVRVTETPHTASATSETFSSQTSSPNISPQSAKRRKMGISNPTTPSINSEQSFKLAAQPSSCIETDEHLTNERDTVLELLKTTGEELSLDVDSLLTSVGHKLDELDMLDVSTSSHSETSLATSSSSDTNLLQHSKKPAKLDLANLHLESGLKNSSLMSPPAIAGMPASEFTAFSPTSSCHSQQSSFDFNDDGSVPDIVISPTHIHERTPIPPRRGSGSGASSFLGYPHRSAFSPVHQGDREALSGGTKSASQPPSSTSSAREKAKVLSTSASLRQKKSPIMSKKVATTSSTNLGRGSMRSKKASAPALVPSLVPSTSDSRISSSDKKQFTSALPPRPPSGKKPSNEAGKTADHGAPTSSTGLRRPRTVVIASSAALASSTRPASASNITPSSSRQTSTSNLSSASASRLSTERPKTASSSRLSVDARGGAARSSARSSIRAKKTSAYSTTPTHTKTNSLPRDSHTLRPASSKIRSSMRASTTHRPKSAAVSSRRGSNPSSMASSAQEARKISTRTSPARRSLTRSSSGEIPRKIKPGASMTLGRDRKTSTQPGSVYASMRVAKSSSTLRPQSAGNALTRNANTRSMRLSRNSVTRKSTHGGTLPRSTSALTRRATPPSIVVGGGGGIQPSAARHSLKRKTSSGRMEVFSAFDEISAQAEGSLLTSSDHRRVVRPKMRQKASTSHLKQLRQRKDVTSEFSTGGSCDTAEDGLDPNTYSTYMSKKNLDPTAIAGLAAKLDFTTVKLRKTGIVEQMIAEQAGKPVDNRSASPNPAAGVEYVTTHPVLLLKIKGRRHIQTRLVEPASSSINSGDVFIAVTGEKLYHWVGKGANVIEKARGSDIVMRILHKKELGCHATTAAVIKEEERSNQDSRKEAAFWELLGGKRAVKAAESVPSDEVYERAVNASTLVYELEGEGEKAAFVPSQHNTTQMVNVGLLHTKKILLFDFYSEVYVWIGKMTLSTMRKKAMQLGKKHFESHCRPPVFTHQISPARASGRYRPRSANKSPRHSVLNASGRRKSTRGDLQPRPEWALFGRMSEGSEGILFREKFCDWPEPGRIIKMKGHDPSVRRTRLTVEIQPADVEKLLKPLPPFEGLRLEGDNIHRGQGNYKVSKSSFSCNRVRMLSITKWVVKEFENVLVPEEDHGIFYSGESYVVRWAFTITVVRELEGLTPGMGMFAQDRKYQKILKQKTAGGTSPTEENEKNKRQRERGYHDSESESETEQDSDEETQRVLESGGRDRCAYFFWQGDDSSVSEKGASALMTIELDKEKGPQVRVVQSKEPAAFLNLFSGGMILLQGRSESNSLQNTDRSCRMFCVRAQQRSEACLVEITPRKPKAVLSYNLRSRGCFVIYDVKGRGLFLWVGSKSTTNLQRTARRAARQLKKRLCEVELFTVREGEEPNNLCSLIGDTRFYHSLANESRMYTYTPRLFELVSTTGEFVGNEVIYPARSNETEAFPFLQSDLYATVQPAIFLLDAHYEVYVWLGWWPDEKNKLMREVNATTGSAHSRWLRDKKLALQTAVNYCKGCGRIRTPRAYMVMAGMEHERFVNQFPFWEVHDLAQEANSKGQTGRPTPRRVDAEEELDKYNRTRFTLATLRQRPVPEGVDPAHLEMYLSDEEFHKVLRMDKAHFSTLPGWKQAKLKKEAGLF